jgi:PAS domain S-box-containing protein
MRSSQSISAAASGEAILRSEADAVIAADRDGIIHLWNPGAVRLFGYARDEALGRSLDLIIPERLQARHWAGYRHVLETGESRYGRGDVLAVPAVRKDGSRVSLEFTITPLRDEDGRMVGVVAVMRDVTTRFEELRALRQKLSERAQTSGSSK